MDELDSENDPDERRGLVRQKSFLRGRVYFNNRRGSADCVIRDISRQGARIVLSCTMNIPDIIELYIPQKEQIFRAHLRWRRGDEIGLTFSEAALAPSIVPESNELAQRIAHLEQEIATVQRELKRLKSRTENSGRTDQN